MGLFDLEAVRAVIFDMDGLMVGTEIETCNAVVQQVRQRGHELKLEKFQAMLGLSWPDVEKALHDAVPGLTDPLKVMKAANDALMASFTAAGGAPRKEGLIQLLDDLDRQQIRKIIATSSDRDWANACLGDLKERFPEGHIITGDMGRIPGEKSLRAKPFPDLFLHAAHVLNVPSANCLVLEDSPNGVRAALAAKMSVIWVPDLVDKLGFSAPGVMKAESLIEVQAILAGRQIPRWVERGISP